jgi:hypothetical protein
MLRILAAASGRPVGVGFLVGTTSRIAILTCAHMVEDDRPAGVPIGRGFSGGPAWDPDTGGVLGTVAAVAGDPADQKSATQDNLPTTGLCP